jgi:hypothetical protein
MPVIAKAAATIETLNDWCGHFTDIPLCSARGRNAPDNGRA